MRKNFFYFLISGFAIFFSGCQKEDVSPYTFSMEQTSGANIRIASYNMLFEWNLPVVEEQRWSRRIHQVEHILRDGNIDIIGSQEALTYQIRMIVKDLPEYSWLGIPMTGGDGPIEQNIAIFYKKDRFDVMDHGDFWYSDTPDVVGSYSFSGATWPTKCTWAKFKEKDSGKIFYVFNNHFYPHVASLQTECSKILKSQIMEIADDAPWFVTGDLNALMGTEALNILLDDAFMYDSRAISVNVSGPEGSYTGFNIETPPTSRIDHVLVSSGIGVLNYQIVDEELRTGRVGSDHLPIVVDATIQ